MPGEIHGVLSGGNLEDISACTYVDIFGKFYDRAPQLGNNNIDDLHIFRKPKSNTVNETFFQRP